LGRSWGRAATVLCGVTHPRMSGVVLKEGLAHELQHEAGVLSTVRHTNIPRVYAHVEHGMHGCNLAYLLMDRLGSDLHTVLQHRK